MTKTNSPPHTGAAPSEDSSRAEELLAEAQMRARRASDGIERLRREHGIWVGGEDGRAQFLPPDGPVPPGRQSVDIDDLGN